MMAALDRCGRGSQLLGPGNTQALRPFPQFSNVALINPPVGNSSYHAGFVKLERRFSHGLSLLAHYTFYASFRTSMAAGPSLAHSGFTAGAPACQP